MFDRKIPLVAVALMAGALFTGSAQASRVNWSVSINAPAVTTVVSSGHVYRSEPVYYAPAPVYYAPAPVYYQPPPVYYQPQPVVVYRPRHGRGHHHRHDGWRGHRDDGHRDEYGDRRHGDRWDDRGRWDGRR